MKYECVFCNYTSYDFGNFSRHKNSKRHQFNEQKCSSTQLLAIISQELIKRNFDENNDGNKCKYCDQTFKHRSSLSKHQKYRCKIKKDIDEEKEEFNQMKTQIEQLTKTNLNNSETLKKSISTVNYIMKNYDDAPPVKLLEGDHLEGFIEYKGNTEKSIEEVLIHHYEKKKLAQLLGDLIIKEYKKTDPKQQSVWSSDVARLTFIIKQAIKGTDRRSRWIVDKHGIDLTKLIVNPVVEKVIEILREYVQTESEYVQNIHVIDFEIEFTVKEKLKLMERANEVIMNIKLRKISDEILRYIAPHFGLKINDDKSIIIQNDSASDSEYSFNLSESDDN